MPTQPAPPDPSGRLPDLADYRDRLVAGCRRLDGVTSLVFFGSSSGDQAERRDEWSDLDFNVFVTPDAAAELRGHWPFLPYPERIVLGAREGENGGVIVYDDGMLLEFGAGLPWPITDPAREVALDGGDLAFVSPPEPPDPANEIRLFLAKLYIGVGRYRRGERAAAGAHVRTYALTSLAWALRARLDTSAPANPYDPLRRLELALPDLAPRIDELLDADLETSARGLLDLACDTLEPGWPDFPSAAVTVIRRRLGWTRPV